ncbi:hypothetical protein Moror_12866 [Moniliophthora roreri MCA 2997]|uniref:J domain-containing protein n=1 Tax=Moniliophthora roreri (strain MCA 2997) TaxID=1381753 RepID=V2XNE4_MONRO|nr:hypothetical protein Moror_12866 [Moniliophthora roreri MCA 2997]
MAPPTTTTTIKQPQSQNWYKILGVRNDASKEEIKAAYKKLSLAWHPDRHIDDKNMATTKYAEVNNAYRAIMLERHIAAVNKVRQEAAHPPASGSPESRPPVFHRPSWSTRRGSSTSTVASSFNSSSRQSSFESVTTAPSTPRFLTRTPTRGTDASSFNFDRPPITPPAQSIDEALQDYFSLPSPVTPVAPSSPKFLSASMADIPEVVNSGNEHLGSERLSVSQAPSEQPSVAVSQSRTTLCDAEVTDIVYNPPKPQPPYSVKKSAGSFGSRPELSSYGIGTSKEWKYFLVMSLEDLYHGKNCRFRITRYHLSGEKVDVVLDVEIAPGTCPGTKIPFRGVGHERPDHTFQDIVFVVQQANHDRFSRNGDDLSMTVQLPRSKANGRLSFTSVDGGTLSVKVDSNTNVGSCTIIGAGMPKLLENEIVGRGNLLIHWNTAPPPPRWRWLRAMLWFRK